MIANREREERDCILVVRGGAEMGRTALLLAYDVTRYPRLPGEGWEVPGSRLQFRGRVVAFALAAVGAGGAENNRSGGPGVYSARSRSSNVRRSESRSIVVPIRRTMAGCCCRNKNRTWFRISMRSTRSTKELLQLPN